MGRLATPPDWGLPPKFDQWRTFQDDAVLHGIDTEGRFVAQAVPTGGGKSLIYVAQAHIGGGRTAVVTKTKGLQDQLVSDFGDSLGLVSIKGKSSYQCKDRPGWTCEDGHAGRCRFKGSCQCDYTKAYLKARASQLVVTNYSYWIAIHKYGMGLGEFSRVAFDEAHHAPEELAAALQVRLSYHEIEELLGTQWPTDRGTLAAWKVWASRTRLICAEKVMLAKVKVFSAREAKHTHIRELQHLNNLNRKLATVAQLRPSDWVVDEWVYGYQFDPIRPARYAESTLFLHIPRIGLFSATIRPKTLWLLGVSEGADFWDYPSTFDPRRSPIRWVRTVRVDHRLTPDMFRTLVLRNDQIMGRRLDRKGIIHTVSYKLRNQLKESTDYADLMMSNYEGDITSEVVGRFKEADAPKALVTPSVTTGYDFPDDDCRYQTILKLPFPDGRSKVMAARQEADPEYGPYLTMQTLVQAAGRSTRSDKDWSEIFILDDHAAWFIPKHANLAPQWFLNQYQEANALPPPMQGE